VAWILAGDVGLIGAALLSNSEPMVALGLGAAIVIALLAALERRRRHRRLQPERQAR
jgi:hypothetical protein